MSDLRPHVNGIALDPQTRCAHYNKPVDIVAIQMKCCGEYYACKECHDALAGHPIQLWPQREWDRPAVLCGACGSTMSINQYLRSSNRCPDCAAAFNPRCRNHYRFYFDMS